MRVVFLTCRSMNSSQCKCKGNAPTWTELVNLSISAGCSVHRGRITGPVLKSHQSRIRGDRLFVASMGRSCDKLSSLTQPSCESLKPELRLGAGLNINRGSRGNSRYNDSGSFLLLTYSVQCLFHDVMKAGSRSPRRVNGYAFARPRQPLSEILETTLSVSKRSAIVVIQVCINP